MESFLECNTRERGFTFKLEEMTRRSCEVTRETHQEWQSTLANLLGQTIELFSLQRDRKFFDASKMPTEGGGGEGGESLIIIEFLTFDQFVSAGYSGQTFDWCSLITSPGSPLNMVSLVSTYHHPLHQHHQPTKLRTY